MLLLIDAGLIALGYLMGSIPFGLIVVKLMTGKDIRSVESGRTGGTNAMRAAGYGAGIMTAVLDVLKGAAAYWIVAALTANPWAHVFAAVGAILGHNYSIFLPERDANGKFIRLRGGAGGAPTVGGALGMWWPSVLIIIPVGALAFFGIGYASVATMSVGLTAIVIFAARAYLGLSPWEYVAYGVIAELLLMWALRPNIQRLLNGTERGVSWRAKKQAAPIADPADIEDDMD
jgi:glycerol-3-phosphate acyltransferase PlsY